MKRVLIFLAVIIGTHCYSQKQWKVYKPVSSGLLGYTVIYEDATKELSPIRYYKSEMDIPRFGASSDFEEFKKSNNIDILGLNFGGYKVTTINAKGNIYIDKLRDAENYPGDVNFVYSGLRSDSVEVTYQRQTLVDIKPDEIIDLARKLGAKCATRHDSIAFVDSIRFRTTGNVTMAVRNPNVYYSVQIGYMKRDGEFPSDWGLTFNPGSRNNQTPMTLKVGERSRTVDPRRGKFLGIFKRYNKPVSVWLEVEKDGNGKSQLYLKHNHSNDRYLIPRNSSSNTGWYYQGGPAGFITSYNIKGELYKLLEIIIEAKENPDGSITIDDSVLTYPEGKFKIK